MSDDWRLRVELVDEGAAKALTERLEAEELSQDFQSSYGDRLIVSGQHGWHAEFDLKRWHPTAEEWEDPDKPLPQSDAERAAEHAVLVAREREETTERGYAEYEVKIHCSSHRDTVKLADRLRGEGLPVAQRWKYLLVGAADEDAANALATRLRAEAPAGATVTAEVSQRAAYDDDPGRGSFAIFGGLGG
jgi:hypothetical protein